LLYTQLRYLDTSVFVKPGPIPTHLPRTDLAFLAQSPGLDSHKADHQQNKYMHAFNIPSIPSIPSVQQILKETHPPLAREIFRSVFGHYKFLKTQLKPDQTINLVCFVGGQVFDVFSASAEDRFLEITSQDADGGTHIITTPFELIAFDIIISKKTNDVPPREIGFKAAIAKLQP